MVQAADLMVLDGLPGDAEYFLWYSRYSGWALVDVTGETINTYGRDMPDDAKIKSDFNAFQMVR